MRRHLQEVLTYAKVEYSELKGSGLAAQLYPDPAARFSKDIDLLVGTQDGAKALRALTDAGYVAKSKSTGKANRFTKLEMWALKDTSVSDPQFDQQIELHHRLFQSEPDGMSPAFMDATDGAMVPQIGNPFYVFYLLMHGAHCHWASLKWALDFALLVKQSEASPDCVFDVARSFHSLSAISASVEFIHSLFPTAFQTIGSDWLVSLKPLSRESCMRLSATSFATYPPDQNTPAIHSLTGTFMMVGSIIGEPSRGA